MHELKGKESIDEIRRLVKKNPCLHCIKLTGRGRTKKVIISEINQQIRISNLIAQVQILENNLCGTSTDVQRNSKKLEFVQERLNVITADIKYLNEKIKGGAGLQPFNNAANDNKKIRNLNASKMQTLEKKLNEIHGVVKRIQRKQADIAFEKGSARRRFEINGADIESLRNNLKQVVDSQRFSTTIDNASIQNMIVKFGRMNGKLKEMEEKLHSSEIKATDYVQRWCACITSMLVVMLCSLMIGSIFEFYQRTQGPD